MTVTYLSVVWRLACAALLTGVLAACAPRENPAAFQATLPSAQVSAPVDTPIPSLTPTATATDTPAASPTPTITLTPSVTFTPTIGPTPPPLTLTPASSAGAPPAFLHSPADFSPPAGWSCDDFPCEDDIAGFLARIRVPNGYTVEWVGRFPGQPMQITYGIDGRLYATVLENGTRVGAVYALNGDGSAVRYSESLFSPIGLAFQPGTDTLYVAARLTPLNGGGLWRVPPGGGQPELVAGDLPCCFSLVDNQPNGLIFGQDGYLYLGVGALTDHAESPNPNFKAYADIYPLEASILRIHPHTGQTEVFAGGLRNPYDLAVDSSGQLYATDNGLIAGPGDRLVAVMPGAHYGWPYWSERGCVECPPKPPGLQVSPDLALMVANTTPRGLLAYTGTQFPVNLFDNLFVALWNGTPDGQRVVRIDPRSPLDGQPPEPFVTGLIRPIDLALAPDGTLVIADYVYGHIWRVRYTG